MYIPGHEMIINDTLAKLSKNQRDIVDTGQLKTGLFYPDLPCGKYNIISRNNVFMTSKTTCSFINLLKLYDPNNNEFYEIFQSHKGILAYLHSMSSSPSYTARDVRTAILNQCLTFFLLAMYDDNIFMKAPKKKLSFFWLGMLLHIIMDSYSPAHTIRKETSHIDVPPRSIYTPSRLMRKRVRDVILDIIKNDIGNRVKTIKEFTVYLRDIFEDDAKSNDYISNHLDQIYNSYLMFMFDMQTTAKIQSIIGKYKPKEYQTYKPKNITNFMYYNNQFNFYHQKKDFLYNIDDSTYNMMIDDCIFIFNLLFEASKLDVTSDPKYLKMLLTYLTDNTFRMTKKDLDFQTGPVDLD
jgi:hypothetical protein